LSSDETKHSIAVDSETELAPSGSSTPAASGVESLPKLGEEAYARKGEIARGGLGRIVEATDKRLRRVVALKELRRHTPEAAARFVREALVTARLQHPGIVPIYEAGRWSDGEPFYAMKLVSGTSLADAIAARPTLDDRLALIPRVIAIADTIAYAHGQRVIHRDLKPHNVMCGEFGETVVIDWGLAKDLAAPDEPVPRGDTPSGDGSDSGHTVAGTVMGTPGYMPPEQAAGETVDERADVYALGAILYHVLAGKGPLKDAPPAPLDPDVPRDLAAIVTKAMAEEIADRYPSAKEMAEDLRRFEAGKLVSVREYTPAERLSRWVRRHRAAVGIGAIATVALVVTGVVGVVNVVRERDRANRETVIAQQARVQSEARRGDLTIVQARTQLEHDPTATLAWLQQLRDDRLDATTASIAADAVSHGVAAHVVRFEGGRVYGLALGTGGRGWILVQDGRLYALDTQAGTVRVAWTSSEAPISLAANADGTVVAIGGAKSVTVIEAGMPVVTAVHSAALAVAFDARGDTLAAGTVDGRVLVRARGNGDFLELGQLGGEVRALAFSPDDKYLAAAAFDGSVAVYRLSDRARVVRGTHRATVWALAWSPDSSAIATASQDNTAGLWPLVGAPVVVAGHTAAVMSVAFDASGQHLATGSHDHSAKIWTRDGKLIATLPHDDAVFRVLGLPNGGWATATSDHLVRRWDAAGALIAVWRGHDDFVTQLALAPDGKLLASAGQDGSVRLWPTALDREVVVTGARPLTTKASVHGGHLWLGSTDRGAIDGVDRLFVVDAHVVFGIGNGKLVRSGDDGTRTIVPPAPLGGATEQGGVVFAAGYDGKLWRWTDLGAPAVGYPADANYVLAIQRVPGGDMVATSGADGRVRLWHVDGRAESVLAIGDFPIHQLAVSSDGKLVAGGDISGVVVVWRTTDGKEVVRYHHTGVIQALAFAPASDRIASVGDDRVVQLYALDGTHETLTGHVQVASSVAISPDGKLVASGAIDGAVRVWDISTKASRVVRGHRGSVSGVAFDDGGGLLTASADGTEIRWPPSAIAPPPATAAELRAWIAARTDATVPP
jgi:WD40 repeat protein